MPFIRPETVHNSFLKHDYILKTPNFSFIFVLLYIPLVAKHI